MAQAQVNLRLMAMIASGHEVAAFLDGSCFPLCDVFISPSLLAGTMTP
jgi:hypothetical protein